MSWIDWNKKNSWTGWNKIIPKPLGEDWKPIEGKKYNNLGLKVLKKELPTPTIKSNLWTLQESVEEKNYDNRSFIEVDWERIYEWTDKYNKIMWIEIEPSVKKIKKQDINYKKPKEVHTKKLKINYSEPIIRDEFEETNLTDERYKEEYETLIEEKISINTIQNEMIQKWIIQENDLWDFWEKTAKYIYEYHPNYYLNSSVSSVKNRAENLIKLNEWIDKEEMLQTFYNTIEIYKNYSRDKNMENWEKIILYARNWGKYRTKNKKLIFWSWHSSNPIGWTAIAKWLNKNPQKLKWLAKNNNIYVFKNKNNKFVLYYYLGWKLRVASYVSPWNPKYKYSEKKSKAKIWTYIDWNHISGSKWDKNIKYKNWKYTWATMPISIAIPWTDWEFFHASLGWNGKADVWVNWKLASHWCTRMPPFYVTVLAKYISNLI